MYFSENIIGKYITISHFLTTKQADLQLLNYDRFCLVYATVVPHSSTEYILHIWLHVNQLLTYY